MSSSISISERILYRVPEAAKLLGVSVSQCYNLVNRGDIESIRLGHSLRIPARALEKIAAGDTGRAA
jgi:excisionase family DNA binding protein